jgi:hypothetical protein
MKFNIERSNEIKMNIAQNRKLMGDLSAKITGLFKKHKIDLGRNSYLFEPRVFTVAANELPEIVLKSREALAQHLIADFYARGEGYYWEESPYKIPKIPLEGIYAREHLVMMEKLRIADFVRTEAIENSAQLARSIVGNKTLMNELTEAIFPILEEHNIRFAKNESCVFTPMVAETPPYVQKVGVAKSAYEVRGFGPQVLAESDQQASLIKPGVIEILTETGHIMTAGIIAKRWWWIGIPSPELLVGLDAIR